MPYFWFVLEVILDKHDVALANQTRLDNLVMELADKYFLKQESWNKTTFKSTLIKFLTYVFQEFSRNQVICLMGSVIPIPRNEFLVQGRILPNSLHFHYMRFFVFIVWLHIHKVAYFIADTVLFHRLKILFAFLKKNQNSKRID